MGVDITDLERRGIIAADSEEGRIIALVPEKKQSQFRLSNTVLVEIDQLSQRLEKGRADVVELAVTHLYGTVRAGQPVYIDPPPDAPKSHKRGRRVA